jgi:hypothetical protein
MTCFPKTNPSWKLKLSKAGCRVSNAALQQFSVASSEAICSRLVIYKNGNALVFALFHVIPLPPRDQGKRRTRASSCPSSLNPSGLETKAGEVLMVVGFFDTPSSAAYPLVGKMCAGNHLSLAHC